MHLINCEIKFILTWSEKRITASYTTANQAATFTITDTQLHVSVVTLSSQDKDRLLQQLESGAKRTNNWNKYQSK